MRGPSTWSIGERELMAAMVAKWNSCAFCVGTHAALADDDVALENDQPDLQRPSLHTRASHL
jgi:alkylhydroperoxidase family enzyme